MSVITNWLHFTEQKRNPVNQELGPPGFIFSFWQENNIVYTD